MDIHQLRVFAAVFRNRSFSKASQELHLTQPTISNHIKSLEDELNCRLFDRLGRSIIPTKEAEALYGPTLEIVEKVDTFKDTIGELRRETAGRLVIGASTIPGVYLMPRIIARFQKRYPAVTFQILINDSSGVVESIARHELLLGIVGAKLGNDRIEYSPFVEDELIVVIAPSQVERTTMTLKEVVSLPMVFREEGSGTRLETERFLEKAGISRDKLKISGIFGSTDAVKQAVKAGLGISIVSKFSVQDELEHHLLEQIHLSDVRMTRTLYIAIHKKRTLSHVYETFLKHLHEIRESL